MATKLADIHSQRNRVTRGDWESFAPHRQRITELIVGAARSVSAGPRTLCVLGAGNGNDLNFQQFADHYSRITLVDLDCEALAHCFDQQDAAVQRKLRLIGGADVSGLLSSLEDLDQEMVHRASDPPIPPDLKRHDVVVSTCLLTQLIDSVVMAFGNNLADCTAIVLALRDGHVKMIRELCESGGTSILITDFVSSDTLPQLKSVSEDELQPLLLNAIQGNNFFTGVNPNVLAEKMQSVSQDGHLIAAQVGSPWRWQMGDRVFAVCAIQRREQNPESRVPREEP